MSYENKLENDAKKTCEYDCDNTSIETHNDICEQANLIIQNVDVSLAKDKSQRRLLEHDALLTHLTEAVFPELINDNNVLFKVQSWMSHLHRPSWFERSEIKQESKNDKQH
ncbi:hypothetical protein ABZ131_00245 [Providencia rettgeri]